MLADRTPAFEAFVAPARPRAETWRLALGLVLVAVIYFGLLLALSRFAARLGHLFGIDLFGGGDGHSFATPVSAAFALFSFSALVIAVLLVTRTLHKRGLGSLLGPDPGRVRADFVLAFHVLFPAFALLLILLLVLNPAEPNLPVGRWLLWLPLSLPLLLLQVAAEEIVFRGYLLQQLAARFRSRWIWLVLPAALFGYLHFNPAENGANAWLVAFNTGLFGLIAADLTARSGNLGAAIALHFVNNLFALLIVALPGDMNGLSLYVAGALDPAGAEARRLIWLDIGAYLLGYYLYLRYLGARRSR